MRKVKFFTHLITIFLLSLWSIGCIDNLSDGDDLLNSNFINSPDYFSYLYGKTIRPDGTPIDSVNTTFLSKKNISDKDGSYKYELTNRGNFDVYFEKDGFLPVVRKFSTSIGDSTIYTVNAVLYPVHTVIPSMTENIYVVLTPFTSKQFSNSNDFLNEVDYLTYLDSGRVIGGMYIPAGVISDTLHVATYISLFNVRDSIFPYISFYVKENFSFANDGKVTLMAGNILNNKGYFDGVHFCDGFETIDAKYDDSTGLYTADISHFSTWHAYIGPNHTTRISDPSLIKWDFTWNHGYISRGYNRPYGHGMNIAPYAYNESKGLEVSNCESNITLNKKYSVGVAMGLGFEQDEGEDTEYYGIFKRFISDRIGADFEKKLEHVPMEISVAGGSKKVCFDKWHYDFGHYYAKPANRSRYAFFAYEYIGTEFYNETVACGDTPTHSGGSGF
ncbi:MAG TPA: hypothetical protein VFC94_04520 [Bacteroidaceae bacterium]|nr:hypothetical protein [Bacteroidaceae bacterium]